MPSAQLLSVFLPNRAALSYSVLIVTVPGLILGLTHMRDWGAKLGSLICVGAAITVLSPVVRTLFG
jgi:hypothetical protein